MDVARVPAATAGPLPRRAPLAGRLPPPRLLVLMLVVVLVLMFICMFMFMSLFMSM